MNMLCDYEEKNKVRFSVIQVFKKMYVLVVNILGHLNHVYESHDIL